MEQTSGAYHLFLTKVVNNLQELSAVKSVANPVALLLIVGITLTTIQPLLQLYSPTDQQTHPATSFLIVAQLTIIT